MAVAALILGIIALCVSFFPILGVIAIVPAILGLIFSIIAMTKKNPNVKAMAITGLIISAFSIMITIFWIVMLCFIGIGSSVVDNSYENSELYNEQHTDDALHSMYSVNENIKLGDRVLKIEKVEKNSGTNEYAPKKNNQFIFVTVSMKNTSTHDILYNCDDFSLSSNEIEYQTDYYQVKSNTTFTKDDLEEGETETGVLCFEVPNDCSKFILQYENINDKVNVQFSL